MSGKKTNVARPLTQLQTIYESEKAKQRRSDGIASTGSYLDNLKPMQDYSLMMP